MFIKNIYAMTIIKKNVLSDVVLWMKIFMAKLRAFLVLLFFSATFYFDYFSIIIPAHKFISYYYYSLSIYMYVFQDIQCAVFPKYKNCRFTMSILTNNPA